ncbi:unnamed protein product [Lymnaea stagnalis]|uniref:Death domain-containing protein n=1 Tax=Lymnaea stagnalis TaxID=6523 RepID=A0AAV2HKB2_LYMST
MDLIRYWIYLAISHLLHTFILCIVDMNPQELQYVSDHLTNKKCNELMQALQQKGFELHREKFRKPDLKQKMPPCLVRLREWSLGPGHNMTFEFLALRLKEIGLEKVADTLSRSVLGETVLELHQFFLDDPFKEMIPTQNLMLDKSEETTKLIPVVDGEDKDEKLFVTIIILTVICLTLCMSLSVCLVCPRLGHFVCDKACPSMCTVIFDIIIDGCLQCWYSSRKSMDKYLLQAPKGGGGLMV